MPTNSDSGRAGFCLTRPRNRVLVWLGVFAVAAAFGSPGCGPPQVDPAHRDLILKLATATSNRDSQLLDRCEEELTRLRSEERLAGVEEAEFLAIIASARSDDWEKARRRAYALRDAQSPTEADRERLKSRPLPPPRTLSKGNPPG